VAEAADVQYTHHTAESNASNTAGRRSRQQEQRGNTTRETLGLFLAVPVLIVEANAIAIKQVEAVNHFLGLILAGDAIDSR